MQRVRHQGRLDEILTSGAPQRYSSRCPGIRPGCRPVLTENPDQSQSVLTLVTPKIERSKPSTCLVEGLYGRGISYGVHVVVNEYNTLGGS